MSEAVVHPDGRLVLQGRSFRCALGRGGVIDAARKREGDGGTPTGLLPLRRLHYRADRIAIPRSPLPRSPIAIPPAKAASPITLESTASPSGPWPNTLST